MPQTFLKHQALQIQNNLQYIFKHKMPIWVSSQERFLESIKKGMKENVHLWKEEKKQEEELKWWQTKAQGHRQTATKDAKAAKYVNCNTTTQVPACKPSVLKKQIATRLQNAFCLLLDH